MEGRSFAFFGTLVILVLVCAAPSTVSGAARFKRQAVGGDVGVNATIGTNASLTAPLLQAFNGLLNISATLPVAVQQALLQFIQTGGNTTANLTAALNQILSQASAAERQVIQNFLTQLQNATQAGQVVIQQLLSAANVTASGLQSVFNVTGTLLTQLAQTIAQNAFTPIAAAAQSLINAIRNGTFFNAFLDGTSSGALVASATAAQITQFLQNFNSLNAAFSVGIGASLSGLTSFFNLAVNAFLAPIQIGGNLVQLLLGFFGSLG